MGKIILYGELARRAGTREINIQTSGRTLLELLHEISKKYGLEDILFRKNKVRPIFLIVIDNKDYLSLGLLNTKIKGEKTIKIIPTVHGGSL